MRLRGERKNKVTALAGLKGVCEKVVVEEEAFCGGICRSG